MLNQDEYFEHRSLLHSLVDENPIKQNAINRLTSCQASSWFINNCNKNKIELYILNPTFGVSFSSV